MSYEKRWSTDEGYDWLADPEERAALSDKDRDALDDSDFAYIDSKGDRHLPIHDEAHVRAALARFSQTQFESDADKKSAAKKIAAAAKKFDITVDPTSPVGKAAGLESKSARSDPTSEDATVSTALTAAKQAVAAACAAQDKDPDNGSDPDDAAVSAHLQTASQALEAALAAQAKDETPEPRSKRRGKPRHRGIPSVGREVRFFTVRNIEVRSANGGAEISVSGNPIAYGVGYNVMDFLGTFEETMHAGVCENVLGDDVRFLFNHDGLPMARTASGTLELDDRSDGLYINAALDGRQQLANDLAIAIERGDVNQMSCAFSVANDTWSDTWTKRDIYRFAGLYDVSAVTYPASPTTSIEVGQRMLDRMPIESRARVRRLWLIARELREGKVLSQANADFLQQAADALGAVDVDGLSQQLAAHAGHVQTARQGVAAVLDAAQTATQVGPLSDGTTGSNETEGTPIAADDGTGSRAALALEAELMKLRARNK